MDLLDRSILETENLKKTKTFKIIQILVYYKGEQIYCKVILSSTVGISMRLLVSPI
jgi:hypothetical protein